jgi:hypothetical protein
MLCRAALGLATQLLCGCGWMVSDTENIGGLAIFWSITGVYGGDLEEGQTETFVAQVAGASGPYNVVWDFGGGATPNRVEVDGENGATTSVTVVMGSIGTYTGSVIATDVYNPSLIAGPFMFTYTVQPFLPPDPNDLPRIDNATFEAAAHRLVIAFSDPDADEDELRVEVTTLPPELRVLPLSHTIGNHGTALFDMAFDLSGGSPPASVVVGFTVRDSKDWASPETTLAVPLPLPPPGVDTLLATPLSETVAVGEPVTVLVLTSVPANAFQYLVGAGLTVESDATYVLESFNVGEVGGAEGDADGIWAAMNGGAGPSSGFFLAPDQFIQSTEIDNGLERWDFNITPLGGNDLTASAGALFNVQFTFSTPGLKHFGFEQQDRVKRTYYADFASEYFWGDIENSGYIVRNWVEVQ